MYRYEQHCPVARAAEVITEPWTLLVVRELLRGSERRADIARGVPKMSASLLAARLRTLESHGLVTRADRRYRLTEAGRELRPIVEQLGRWGQRWLDSPRLGDLDPELLVFDICQEIDRARLPAHPLTVRVDFADAAESRRWWLVLSRAEIVVRPHGADGGFDSGVDGGAEVRLSCTLGALAGVWLGHLSWLEAVRDRSIMLAGDAAAVRTLIDCLGASRYATVTRAAEQDVEQEAGQALERSEGSPV